MNGSSAALEAGAQGKLIICFGRQYESAGIAFHINSDDDWNRLNIADILTRNKGDIVRASLRYVF
jgi:hypothetical protein